MHRFMHLGELEHLDQHEGINLNESLDGYAACKNYWLWAEVL